VKGTPNIAVIGGGIGGLGVALGLQRAGISVTLFEQADRLRASGGALLLWSNGMRALGALGLADEVASIATIVEHTDFRTADGRSMWVMPVGELSRAAGSPTVLITRAELLGILASAVGEHAVRCSERCVQVVPGNDSVELRMQNGTSERFDGVIGADGLHSTVRAALLGETPPRRAGHVAWVGIADHVTTHLPIGRTVATIGQGLRFCCAALVRDRVFWYAAVGARDAVTEPTDLARCFRGFHQPVEEVIRATRSAAMVRTEVRDRAPVRSWSNGCVTLLGDAAHPSTPDLGQGACQALESAVHLSVEVARSSVPIAFARYQRTRLDRSAKITNFAWLTALQSMSTNPLVSGLRTLAFRTLLPTVATTELERILGDHGISSEHDLALSRCRHPSSHDALL
jgi:2-polyprenyl-6-methoxyphenol hydroxylase-like FAD-dependent oxidoreductase